MLRRDNLSSPNRWPLHIEIYPCLVKQLSSLTNDINVDSRNNKYGFRNAKNLHRNNVVQQCYTVTMLYNNIVQHCCTTISFNTVVLNSDTCRVCSDTSSTLVFIFTFTLPTVHNTNVLVSWSWESNELSKIFRWEIDSLI